MGRPKSGCATLSYVSYGTTLKRTLLESVRYGVSTWTLPVVAPIGTVTPITELEIASITAGVPLNVTLVAPVRLVPRILTVIPSFA